MLTSYTYIAWHLQRLIMFNKSVCMMVTYFNNFFHGVDIFSPVSNMLIIHGNNNLSWIE